MNAPRRPPAWLLRLALFCCALLPSLSAQPSAPAPAQTLTLRFMSWEQAIPGLFLKTGERSYLPVSAPAYGWGAPVQAPASKTLKLFHLVEREGRKTHEVAVEAPLADNCLDFQVALLRRAGESPYHLIALPADPRLFQARDVRLFNFTPHPAMIRLGGETISLAPLEWRKVATTPDRKYRLTLLSALQVAGAWVPSSQQIITLRPDYRGEVTLVHSAAHSETLQPAAPGRAARALTLVATEPLPPSAKTAARD